MSDPNIVLLVMDTARQSTVSDMINKNELPNISKLVNKGTRFTNCMTTGPWTLPSHASMFTGQYTSKHCTHAGSRLFDPEVPTLAEYARKANYHTLAYSNNTWVSPEFGFDKGFDDFLVRWELTNANIDLSGIEKADSHREKLSIFWKKTKEDPINSIASLFYAIYLNYSKQDDSGANRTNTRLEKILLNEVSSPFFLFINYVEPHLPYSPPREFLEKYITDEDVSEINQNPWEYLIGEVEMTEKEFQILESLYRAELNYLDQRIGELLDILSECGEFNDTMFIIVGDHGENIGDYGFMDHQYCLYDTLINVPLIFYHPEHFCGGEAFDGLVELRDIYPTVLDLLGVDIDGLDNSVSVNTLLSPNDSKYERDYTISEYLEPQPSQEALQKHTASGDESVSHFDRALRCIRTRNWKYIEASDDSEYLYDISVQKGENKDLILENNEKKKELRGILCNQQGKLIRNPGKGDVKMDNETKSRLEDLGYIQ